MCSKVEQENQDLRKQLSEKARVAGTNREIKK
jgi:hypothetical protein